MAQIFLTNIWRIYLNMTEQSIGQRIKFLIEATEFSVRKFAQAIDVSETNIRNYTDRGTKPSSDVLEKIALQFPQTNLEWLLTGRGAAFKTDSDGGLTQTNIAGKKNAVNVAGGKANQTNIILTECERERDAYKAERDLARQEAQSLREQLAMKDQLLAAKDEMLALLRGGYNRPN